MRLLLDSHVLVWWLQDDTARMKRSVEHISDGANEVVVSAASIWELSIKQSLGKLTIDDDLHERTGREGFRELPVSGAHAAAVRELPLHHGDPFDRILVVQARLEGLTLVTADRALAAYDVPILPA